MEPFEIFEQLWQPSCDDPYALYAALHEHGEFAELAKGARLVFGYDAIDVELRNPACLVEDAQRFDDIFPSWRDHPSLAMQSIQSVNPPRHTTLRRVMSQAFTRRNVDGMEVVIAQIVEDLLDGIADSAADGAAVDFIDRFAYPLPSDVICELIGVPAADRALFGELAVRLATALEQETDAEVLREADAAAVQFGEYVADLAARRRRAPQDDFLSTLVQLADTDPGEFTNEVLLDNVMLLLVAGFETTTSMFGSGLHIMLDRPALRESLGSGELGVGSFVDEVLRFEPPVQLAMRRRLETDVAPEETVMLLLGAGNRDPKRFLAPNEFDPRRDARSTLSFGAGAHFCLGAALARIEAAIAFPALLRRFPDIARAGEPVLRPGFVLRGFTQLPIEVGSSRTSAAAQR